MPLWVPILVVAIIGGQLLLWTTLFLVFRKRTRRLQAELPAKLQAAGEVIKRGPETGNYSRGTMHFSSVGGVGVAVLTDKRLVFQKVTGGIIVVPLDQIADIREDKWFLGAYRGNRTHTILQMK